ncbi:unnamed protein product [Sphenostylis stenocarpa]|uniref:Uncharacterized protein n=1 Tax=Sphenostylis stenocarpa TaxID=92480 RepID=A0AA86W3E3_9FABA|nr:unnamed protein product [Sphenostylis stenocarpa]
MDDTEGFATKMSNAKWGHNSQGDNKQQCVDQWMAPSTKVTRNGSYESLTYPLQQDKQYNTAS